jgi:phosphohistidine phosphatase
VKERRLIVMRHGKAEQYGSTDHARELTDRGRADAAEAGSYLAAEDLVPTHALVSTATRTRATWEAVADGCGSTAEATFDDALYNGGVHAVLESLRLVPAEAETVIYVGHNPTAEYLAHLLDDGDGDQAAITAMLAGFPTAALAVLEVGVPWSGLDEGAGRVLAFHVGRGE